MDEVRVQNSLSRFDRIGSNIEAAVQAEMRGDPIRVTWPTRPKERTCTVCDFKTFCSTPALRPYEPTVP